jgi:hypothetical protein
MTSKPFYILLMKCITEFISISASKLISNQAGLRPPRASLSSTPLRPPSASLSYSILASKCISKCISKSARSWPPSASLSSTLSRPQTASSNPPDFGLQVHLSVQLDLGVQVSLQTRSIVASKYISQFT